MRHFIFIMSAALLVAACGKGDDKKKPAGEPASKTEEKGGAPTPSENTPAVQDETEKVLADLTAHKDKVCACGDKACAVKAAEEAAAFETDVKTRIPNPTAEQRMAFKELADQLKECLRKHP